MDSFFKISNYLENYSNLKRTGTCKVCRKPVSWSRERLAAHKRGNCPNASAHVKNLFAKRKFSEVYAPAAEPSSASPKKVCPNGKSYAEMSSPNLNGSKSTQGESSLISFERIMKNIKFRVSRL